MELLKADRSTFPPHSGDKQLSITESCKATLEKMGLECVVVLPLDFCDRLLNEIIYLGLSRYLDLYLIHSASLVVGRIPEAWAEMESLKEQGLVKSVRPRRPQPSQICSSASSLISSLLLLLDRRLELQG